MRDPKLVHNMEQTAQRWAEGRHLRTNVSDIEAVYLDGLAPAVPAGHEARERVGPLLRR